MPLLYEPKSVFFKTTKQVKHKQPAPIDTSEGELPAEGVIGLRWLWRGMGFLLVAIVLIFCHPCHGDDFDDELSLPVLPKTQIEKQD